ncbi:MAG: hypothetical protein LC776_13880, partial [Acidobacteria bacterium]|nr:hypothetical protein [Acidobacteriota bacterium]
MKNTNARNRRNSDKAIFLKINKRLPVMAFSLLLLGAAAVSLVSHASNQNSSNTPKSSILLWGNEWIKGIESMRDVSGSTPQTNISITTLGTPITQNFDTLATSGTTNTWTDDSTLPGWYSQFGTTANPATYRADSGGSNTGALYSWGTGTNAERALGTVGSGTTTDIYNALKLTNNTGSTIDSLDTSYVGEQWRQGGCTPTPCTPLAQTVDFQYQVANAGVITDANTPTTGWLDHDPLDFTSPQPGTSTAAALDGNAAANRTGLSSTINVTVNVGQEVWLRWKDINHANNDHGLAVDDFSVTANGGGPTPTPTPTPPPGPSPTPTPTPTPTPVPITPICQIQGSGTASPLAGANVTTEGVVTGLRSNGFFIQQEACDVDTETSDGIFVFTSSA